MVTLPDNSADSRADLHTDTDAPSVGTSGSTSYNTAAANHVARQMRGVRGATTVDRDDATEILAVTQELLTEILRRNNTTKDDVISAFFTVTPDLHAEFPARAARELGWGDVPMLCGLEMDVPNAIQRCIRVLLHVSLPGHKSDVRHVYLRAAEELRPDL